MKTNQYNEPDVIFLQLHDPTDEGKTELADPKAEGVTWCWEQIHHNDVEYIRKDLYDDLKNQITAYQLTIANMEAERDELMKQGPYCYASLNGEDFSYSKSHTETFVGHGWKPLFERPLPAEDKS